MPLRIYNTLTRRTEIFKPRDGKKVSMFVCGPTVYDWAHIGHAKTYIFFDVFAKFLRKLGYDVLYLQNITDVDDKIINRANAEGKSWKTVARTFEKSYVADMRSLHVTAVTKYARASDYIPQIIGQVSRLIEKGFAYESGGDVYFRVKKFPRYGALSGQKLRALKQFEPGEKKEDPLDFALWKASKPGEPQWDSPWASPGRPRGAGRPGWHIEDTAITESFFGPQYDVHGGGVDLLFPHHECEVAQQEAASDRAPFVAYWLHTGHLKVRGEKMAKSLGNFVTIREMLKRVPAETFRLLVLSSHWHSPLDYTDRLLTQAKAAHERLSGLSLKMAAAARLPAGRQGATRPGRASGELAKKLEKEMAAFYDTLEDDLNTPKALSHLFTIVNVANPSLERGEFPAGLARKISAFLKEADSILGIIGKPIAGEAPAEIRRMLRGREQLRKTKKWHAADEMRRKIEKAGWIVEDTPLGPRLRKRD